MNIIDLMGDAGRHLAWHVWAAAAVGGGVLHLRSKGVDIEVEVTVYKGTPHLALTIEAGPHVDEKHVRAAIDWIFDMMSVHGFGHASSTLACPPAAAAAAAAVLRGLDTALAAEVP